MHVARDGGAFLRTGTLRVDLLRAGQGSVFAFDGRALALGGDGLRLPRREQLRPLGPRTPPGEEGIADRHHDERPEESRPLEGHPLLGQGRLDKTRRDEKSEHRDVVPATAQPTESDDGDHRCGCRERADGGGEQEQVVPPPRARHRAHSDHRDEADEEIPEEQPVLVGGKTVLLERFDLDAEDHDAEDETGRAHRERTPATCRRKVAYRHRRNARRDDGIG